MQAILFDITDAEKRTVQCKLCAHYCEIKDGHSGICKIRENSGESSIRCPGVRPEKQPWTPSKKSLSSIINPVPMSCLSVHPDVISNALTARTAASLKQ